MPVRMNAGLPSHDRRKAGRKPPQESLEQTSRCVTIGLVNNMPDSAFKATERQFTSLLNASSNGISVKLALYSLPGVPRTESHQKGYASVETLWGKHLDGLIVTGREPISADLRDEPYWASFARVLEWARENTYSTVWSCLAAHAAVLHMDGIVRRKSEEKHFGVFECVSVATHSLTAGVPSWFKTPHSRWNGLPEEELVAHGYSVLTRFADTEVDAFAKQEESLFVFFQGHPEYESDTLLREYRRDAGRYLKHETSKYPVIPHGYFDPGTESVLSALQEEATSSWSREMYTNVAAALEKLRVKNTWRETAAHIYRNWLEYICERKDEGQHDRDVRMGSSVQGPA
jgi:homoserine O-succinyltransferase/O-acetyltransferase